MIKTQIDLLADYIMAEVPGEPSQNEGAGDCAIRIIKTRTEQLAKFGGHTADCSYHDEGYWLRGRWVNKGKCDCGYAAIAKEMG